MVGNQDKEILVSTWTHFLPAFPVGDLGAPLTAGV